MRGELLTYDDTSGQGIISGDDGVRYNFARADLKQLTPLSQGMRLDFDVDGKQAREIFIVAGAPTAQAVAAAASSPAAGAPVAQGGQHAYDAPPIDETMGPGIWGYFTKCMGLYFNGHGRAQRAEYWSFTLFYTLFLVAALAVGFALAAVGGLLIVGVVYLVFLAPAITVTIRRLHDVGLTGWLIFVGLIPYLGAIFLFVVSLIPSQRHTNKHGPHPKAIEAAPVFD